MSDKKTLHISVSSLEDFFTCRRLYYYKRIKKYERKQFSLPFFVGRVMHIGLGLLFEKKKDPIKGMLEYFDSEQRIVKKESTLTEKQEHDLNEQKYIVQGMLKAYAKRYAKLIQDSKLIASEVEGAVQFDEHVTFVIKMDNLFRVRAKKIMHELKTTKYITPEYVKRIQTDRQTAIYYHLYNIIFPYNKIDEVMYDVIRKPSIRQKKNESYSAFLVRLEQWYEKPDDMSVFHIERFKEPLISEESIINTIMKVSDEMLRSKTKEDYYQDHDKCTSYYGDVCPYYELCHEGGETASNLVLYQIRKSYHVNKENKLTEG